MNEFKVGDEYYDALGKVTVRAVFDGYIAFKRPRCAMAILKEQNFLDKFNKSKQGEDSHERI